MIDDKPIDFTLRRGVSLGLETFAVPKPEYIEVFNDLIIKAAEKRVFLNRVESWLRSGLSVRVYSTCCNVKL